MIKNVATVKKTNEIMVEFGLHAKKNFGQNFLVVQKTVTDIIDLANIDEDSVIIEIGPGIGALTDVLLDRFKKVICFEIDKSLIEPLKHTFSDKDNFELYNEDILKVDLDKFINENLKNEKVVIFSNLPYYITSEILTKLFVIKGVHQVVTMMQKEVAHRILKADKGKDENELTLLAKHYCDFKLIKEVSKNDFFPKPHIDSTVLSFTIKENVPNINETVKILFKQRRKTIYNNLTENYEKDFVINMLNKLNLNVSLRSEDLTIIDIELIDAYLKNKLLFAPAKINLNLQVLDIKDGKHRLKSVVQKINLYDEIIVDDCDSLILDCNGVKTEDNTIYKVIKKMEEVIKEEIHLYIKVIKNIPSQAGLGGGSSDAASVLLYLNQKYNLDDETLNNIAISVGSDIPLFLKDGSVLIEETGEKITLLEDNSTLFYLLIKDDFGINTRDSYKTFDELNERDNFDFDNLYLGLKNNDYQLIVRNIKNDLLKPALKLENKMVKLMKKYPNSFLTGSGSTIFIPFENIENATYLYNNIKNKHYFVKIVQKI